MRSEPDKHLSPCQSSLGILKKENTDFIWEGYEITRHRRMSTMGKGSPILGVLDFTGTLLKNHNKKMLESRSACTACSVCTAHSARTAFHFRTARTAHTAHTARTAHTDKSNQSACTAQIYCLCIYIHILFTNFLNFEGCFGGFRFHWNALKKTKFIPQESRAGL